ncbi:MAG: hypothetical protein ACT4OF_14250 [Caulobacteraceae bacterium]
MIYLIGQLAIWLLLTAAFAGLAGWAFAAERAAAGEEKRQRERDNLLRDLVRFSGDGAEALAPEGDGDSAQRLVGLRDARIAELERSLETARARADELAGELAELQRRDQLNNPDIAELARLRAAEKERARTVDAEAEQVEDQSAGLQTWRLRYFEQRVKYLEKQARAAGVAPVMDTEPRPAPEAAPIQDWAAREASARASFLEAELRAMRHSPQPIAAAPREPFAADADVDMLLRWRMLYLERRVTHLQGGSASQIVAPVMAEAAPDPDRWKWRARYLEARVRHLEQRPVQAVAPSTVEEPPAVAPELPRPVTPNRRSKPPVLANARNGAPDDLTLIEGVSLLQQTTLHALGVFHFDQIAAWTEEHVAWVDQYLRLQGRIEEEEWVEQAADLARDGPAAARRALEDEEI